MPWMTGMSTLNQSLVNLVLRRKIDVKQAFEATIEPEELESLLKKAGV